MSQHDLETGVTIGDFRIERPLGAGGMGIVYQARQVSLDRAVALKILGPALNREVDRTRFQREAQAVARLNHPGIAAVHFVGQDRHACYMAMEFIDGVSLRAVIDRLTASRDRTLTIDLAVSQGRSEEGEAQAVRFDVPTMTYDGQESRSVTAEPTATATGPAALTPEAERIIASRPYMERCCAVAIEAAEALAHAHERGVVHRDIKPENILLDRQGHAHLIDFGVARFFEDKTLTNTGALIGTPMYMSPEQVTGRIDLDHRSDVYSLGLVLYELLTLVRPIAAPTREGVLRMIVTKALPPASRYNRAIPRDLEGILHKATARDPDERYQSATEFAADLRRWHEGKSVAARPYHYRLDDREIKAERPAGIMVIAFGHFVAAAFSAFAAQAIGWLMWIYSNPEFLKAMTEQQRAAQPLFNTLPIALAITLAISLYGVTVGYGLLSAKPWARWITVAVCSALALCSAYLLTRDLLGHFWRIGTAVGTLFTALAGAPVAYLLRRSTGDWFRLAARVRREHGHGTNGLRRS